MDRLMRKMGAEQAARQTAGLGSFFKKVDEKTPSTDGVPSKPQTYSDSPSKRVSDEADEDSAEQRESMHEREDSAPPSIIPRRTENVSPVQGSEPLGTSEPNMNSTEEGIPSDDDGSPVKRLHRVRRANLSDGEEDEIEGTAAVHRRIRSVNDEDDEVVTAEGEEALKKDEVEKMYFQDVKVVDDGADTDDADDAPEKDEDSDDDDKENSQATKTVLLEDFDDEEEFLLAGGDVEEAKKRKEWGLHQSDDEKEEEVVDLKKDKKTEQEEIRKIYRESERILREKRCMIPPSQAPRLSFLGLFDKVEAKAKELVVPQKTTVSPPPVAPAEDSTMADSQGPVGLAFDDDDDDEFDVVFTDQLEAPRVSEEVNVGALTQAASAAVKTEVGVTPMSPPPPLNRRDELKRKLRQSAFARSEHITAKANSVETKAADPASAEPARPCHFIAAQTFDGGKPGYVFHVGARGVGYYEDLGANKNRHGDAEAVEPASVSVTDVFSMPVTDSQEVDTDLHDTQVQADSELGTARVLELQPDEEDEDDTQKQGEKVKEIAVEKPSIFRSFMGVDEGTAVMHGGVDNSVPAVSGPPRPVTGSSGARRSYGRVAFAKPEEKAKSDAAFEGPKADTGEGDDEGVTARDDFGWREPTLDEEEEDNGDEADDEDGSEEEEEEEEAEEESDEEEEEESDEEEVEEETSKEPEKKSLNDVVSIKKQSALRLGTLEAGYLRNEHEALGISEDIGIAKEDLEEGIDLMDTDGEDNEEELEEDSEEERKVADGFIEDAKFAVQDMDPEAYKEFHQRQQEDEEQRMTDRILDVVRGDVRRRKAQGGEDWIPNRSARQRVLNQMSGKVDENGFAVSGNVTSVEDAATNEEIAAQLAASHAKEKAERIRFQQQKKMEEARQLAEGGGGDDDAGDVVRPVVPLVRRSTSHCGPQLSAFRRQLSFSAQAACKPGAPLQRSSSLLVKRASTSLLGAAGSGEGGSTEGKEKESKLATSRNFFFDKRQKSDADPAPAADLAPVPAKRALSSSAVPFARKTQKAEGAPAKRFDLIRTLDDL